LVNSPTAEFTKASYSRAARKMVDKNTEIKTPVIKINKIP
jgi:hypothetical protein